MDTSAAFVKMRCASVNYRPVRFYTRDGRGRFTSLKFIFMPTFIDGFAARGELIRIDHRGLSIPVHNNDYFVSANKMNTKTVRVL